MKPASITIPARVSSSQAPILRTGMEWDSMLFGVMYSTTISWVPNASVGIKLR